MWRLQENIDEIIENLKERLSKKAQGQGRRRLNRNKFFGDKERRKEKGSIIDRKEKRS